MTKYLKKLSPFVLIILILITISCRENREQKKNSESVETVKVVNFDNKKELAAYTQMNLDSTHPNLLNPQISRSEYDTVVQSWKGLHHDLEQYLSQNDFNWGVKDSTITIVQKIYFNPEGKINTYFFRVINNEVTEEKKEELAHLIASFAQNHSIGIKREEPFAQCGKTRYLN
ncbi:hypothetical protein [Robertkochia aurantiaca]|uniref:hypothetical protein n=1 Tax=Robertkochia aurantiaca TaxID=2873700 RepID=UPI001CCDB8BA|nr:hypothetical protein [Robertkochia sp. 3YJGBD-33]